MYGEDARAVEAWARIKRRESLVEKRSRAQAFELPADEWEDIDLDEDAWKKSKRSATPAGVFAVGDLEDEDDAVKDQERAERHELEAGISDTPIASSQILSAIPNRLSWSTTSGKSTRSGSDVTMHTLPRSLTRASSMREERVASSGRSSVVSRLKGLSRSGSESRRSEEMRNGIA